MKIYNYDKNTHEFTFESKARENPKEKGKFLIPTFSTTKKPPKVEGAFFPIFKNTKWELEEKHVGIYYNKETLEPIKIDIFGLISDNLTLLKPESSFDKWDGNKWIPNSSKKAQLICYICNMYDQIAKKEIDKIFMSIVDETTSNSLLKELKEVAITNQNKKDNLINKSMEKLIEIYNSIT